MIYFSLKFIAHTANFHRWKDDGDSLHAFFLGYDYVVGGKSIEVDNCGIFAAYGIYSHAFSNLNVVLNEVNRALKHLQHAHLVGLRFAVVIVRVAHGVSLGDRGACQLQFVEVAHRLINGGSVVGVFVARSERCCYCYDYVSYLHRFFKWLIRVIDIISLLWLNSDAAKLCA